MADRSQDIKCPECGCEFEATAVWVNALWAVKDAVGKLQVFHNLTDMAHQVRPMVRVDKLLAVIDALAGPCKTCKDHAAIEKEHGAIVWPPHACTGKAGKGFEPTARDLTVRLLQDGGP